MLLSNTSRKWSSSCRSKQTLLALTTFTHSAVLALPVWGAFAVSTFLLTRVLDRRLAVGAGLLVWCGAALLYLYSARRRRTGAYGDPPDTARGTFAVLRAPSRLQSTAKSRSRLNL
jgi:hypothetical protein